MTIDELIFSKKLSHRITRHLVFWAIYCTFFWLQSFAPRNYNELYISDTYYFAFLNLCAFGPVFVLLVYLFIYYLLPYLRQERYGLFLFYFFTFYLAGTLINYYTAGIFLNSVDYSIPIEPTFQHRMEFGNYNTRWGMIIAIIALGIKLSKDWYLQQQENLGILNRKIRTEMRLQKARIHPDMLFRSLDTIYSSIQAGSSKSNSLLLSLSDLLSYSLYESDTEKISLGQELIEVQHLISLENLSDACTIDLQVETERNVDTKSIVPMTIVKLVEGCMSLRNFPDSFWQHLSVKIHVSDTLTATLSFYHLTGLSTNAEAFIENINRKISENYTSEDYHVASTEDGKGSSIKLELKLSGSKTPETVSNISQNSYDPA